MMDYPPGVSPPELKGGKRVGAKVALALIFFGVLTMLAALPLAIFTNLDAADTFFVGLVIAIVGGAISLWVDS